MEQPNRPAKLGDRRRNQEAVPGGAEQAVTYNFRDPASGQYPLKNVHHSSRF